MRARRPAPCWFHVLVAVAAAVALRAIAPPSATGTRGGVSLAFFAFLFAIGELIWNGLQVAAQVTLAFLQWMVTHLSLLLVKVANGLREAWGFIRDGFKLAWKFLRVVYTDVLKPAWNTFWRWFDKARKWLDETFRPVIKWLLKVRASLLQFWKDYVRPWLDLIDVTRKLLHVLGSLGVTWARALDRKLGEIEDMIERPFRFVLGKLNEVINLVNTVVTAGGLLQRVALIRSLARDYQFAWRAIAQPYTRAVTDSDREQANHKLGVKPLTQIEHETREYIHGRGGPRAALLEEMAVIWRKQLRES
jgi:hypothetical protein